MREARTDAGEGGTVSGVGSTSASASGAVGVVAPGAAALALLCPWNNCTGVVGVWHANAGEVLAAALSVAPLAAKLLCLRRS